MTPYESAAGAANQSLVRVRQRRRLADRRVVERCGRLTVAGSCSAAAEAYSQPTCNLRTLLERRSDLICPRVLAADSLDDCTTQEVEDIRADEQCAADLEQPTRDHVELARFNEQERKQQGEGGGQHQRRAVERERPAERPAPRARDHKESDDERPDYGAARTSPIASLQTGEDPKHGECHP
jgi:hypothetical protein